MLKQFLFLFYSTSISVTSKKSNLKLKTLFEIWTLKFSKFISQSYMQIKRKEELFCNYLSQCSVLWIAHWGMDNGQYAMIYTRLYIWQTSFLSGLTTRPERYDSRKLEVQNGVHRRICISKPRDGHPYIFWYPVRYKRIYNIHYKEGWPAPKETRG